jgi:hypothetical protein
MRRSISIVLVALALTTSAAVILSPRVSAQSETIVFSATLLAGNEIAPVVVAVPERGANGTCTMTLNVTRSGGAITAATFRFDYGVFGLASNSVVILSHIHQGTAAQNGPVVVDSGLSPATGLPASGGFVGFSRDNIVTPPALAQSIISNPAGFYFNVHTAQSPQGVARGQLVRVEGPSGGLAAPTLSQWGAILMALMIIATGLFFLAGRRTAAGTTTGSVDGASIPGATRTIDWKRFLWATLAVEAVIGAVLVALRAGPVDVLGALSCGVIGGFIVHLLEGRNRS